MDKTYLMQIDNRKQHVTLRKIEDTLHCMYYLRFENGYENIFFTDIETGGWIEQDLGRTRLAASVGKLINGVNKKPDFVYTNRIIWYIPEPHYWFCFGMIKHEADNQTFYDIFNSNKRFMFTLIHDGEGWKLPYNYRHNKWKFKLNYINDIALLIELNKL